MKRVANCVLQNGNQVLMLQKPRFGWWVVPGGKMESTESVARTIQREFYEETNLNIKNPELRGIFTIVVKDQELVIEEWMMFTFHATDFDGQLTPYSHEGILQWQDISQIAALPKAKGDNIYLEHILDPHSDGLISGTFFYTPDYELISYYIDQDKKVDSTIATMIPTTIQI